MRIQEIKALSRRIASDRPVVLTAVDEVLVLLDRLPAGGVSGGRVIRAQQALLAAQRAITVLARSVEVTSEALAHAAKQDVPQERMAAWYVYVGGLLYAVAEGPDGMAEHPEGSDADRQTAEVVRESAQRIAAEHLDSVVTVVREVIETTRTEITP
jgi:hypothetical protein